MSVFVFQYVDDCQRRRHFKHFKRLKAADGSLVWTDANIHIDITVKAISPTFTILLSTQCVLPSRAQVKMGSLLVWNENT